MLSRHQDDPDISLFFQEPFYFAHQMPVPLRLAFPDHQHLPAQAAQVPAIAPVPFDVAIQLFVPVFDVALRPRRTFTALMAVPEAAVHEYNLLVFGQHDVRPAGQIIAMQPEPKAALVQKRAHDLFGLRVLGTDLRHYAAALFGRESVGHGLSCSRN